MSTAASNDPAVVMTTELLSESCEAVRERADLLERTSASTLRACRLTPGPAPSFIGWVSVTKPSEASCCDTDLRGGFVGQRKEEIQLMRLKRVEALLTQLPNELGIEVFTLFGAPPAPNRQIDAQGRRAPPRRGSTSATTSPPSPHLPAPGRADFTQRVRMCRNGKTSISTRSQGST